MKTQQPDWKLIVNLGDVNPIEYGGYFVYVDSTGVYAPEAELLVEPMDAHGKWEVRRFAMEPCTFTNGVLSDNPYHPNIKAWFADGIHDIANFSGQPSDSAFIASLCGDDVVAKAWAWRAIGEYHGFDNLDSYPLYLTREETEARYADVKNLVG